MDLQVTQATHRTAATPVARQAIQSHLTETEQLQKLNKCTPHMDNQEIPSQDHNPISVGEWVLYLFLLSIPFVNIIILSIWAFGSEPNQTKKNFARAGLIWIAIGIIFYLLLMFLIFGTFTSMMHDMNMQTV